MSPMAELLQALLQRPNFVVFVILFLWGIYIMAAHPNYVKKLIGLYIVQTSVVFFLVAFSAKDGATVPIVSAEMASLEAWAPDVVMQANRPHAEVVPTFLYHRKA